MSPTADTQAQLPTDFIQSAAGGQAPVPPPAVRPTATPPPSTALPATPINILIVDDEPKNLTVLATILDDPSYRLVRATDADQALLALVAEEFALLILDIRMPGMTGFELAQTIKQRKKTARVPIIFLTAYYQDDQHMLEGYGTGAVDYLSKPINAAVLRSKVAVFAELYRQGREIQVANRALLAEVSERRRAEEQLRQLNETLEQRVAERTHELSERERFLSTVTSAARLGLTMIDRSYAYRYANEAYAVILGLAARALVGRHACEAAADGWSLERPLLDRAFGGERVAGELILPPTQAGASPRYFGAFYEPHLDHQGQPTVVVVVVELTDLKRMEGALRDVDRRKNEFLATLAHELRNPLAPVRNAVQVLHMKGPVTPELQWAREVIDRQMQAMTRLIDDLMDVSRIGQGKIELKRERVELTAVLQAALEASRPLIDQMGQELTLALTPEPILLDADLTRLAQVFMNLLNNASKYTDKGGRIKLSTQRQGRHLVVSVKDTGIGIAADKLSTIFEMFSQVEGALSRSQGGLGIGLSLAKRLVELHGGSIAAKSEGPGQGSEFTVWIPLVLAPSGPVKAGGDDQAQPISGLRILVVDDNRDAAVTLATLLRTVGNDVRTAHDGEEAVRVAAEFQPQAVLLDIGLPKLNGYEVARRLREQPRGNSMALIAVTGWGQEDHRRLSEEAGFDEHLVKPVEPLLLMKLLASLVSRRSSGLGPELP